MTVKRSSGGSGNTKNASSKYAFLPPIMELFTAFSYIGYMNNMTPFLNTYGLSDSQKVLLIHAFAAISTSIPILAAYIADNGVGRFKVVTANSILHVIAHGLVLAGSIAPLDKTLRIVASVVGGICLAVAMGVGRSITATFAADQIPEEDVQRREAVFSMAYVLLNSGVIVSMMFLPIVKNSVTCWESTPCHSVVYAATFVSVFIGMCVFLSGVCGYNKKFSPSKSVNKVFRCVITAAQRRGDDDVSDSLMDSVSATDDDIIPKTNTFLDRANPRFTKRFINRVYNLWLTVKVCGVVAIPFFAMYFQIYSSFQIQARNLNPRVENFVFSADQMTVAFPIINVATVYLLKLLIQPLLEKWISVTYLRKMGFGAFLAALAFAVSGVIEIYAVPNVVDASSTKLFFSAKCDVIYNGVQLDQGLSFTFGAHDFKVCNETYTVTFDNVLTHVNVNDSISVRRMENLRPDASRVRLYTETFAIDRLSVNDTSGDRLRFKYNSTDPKEYNEIESPLRSEEEVILSYENVNKTISLKLMMGGAYYVQTVSGTLVLTTMIEPNSLSLMWQLVPILLLAMGEVFLVLTGFEFAFSQSPKSLKAIMQSSWLLFSLLGNCLTMALARVPPLISFFMYCGIMGFCTVIFVMFTWNFRYFTYENYDIDDAELPTESSYSTSDRPTSLSPEEISAKV